MSESDSIFFRELLNDKAKHHHTLMEIEAILFTPYIIAAAILFTKLTTTLLQGQLPLETRTALGVPTAILLALPALASLIAITNNATQRDYYRNYQITPTVEPQLD